MTTHRAKLKVVSNAAPNEEGKWFDVDYSQESLEKLNRSTSWNQTVDIFKPLVPDDHWSSLFNSTQTPSRRGHPHN